MEWPENLAPGDRAVEGQAVCSSPGCELGLWWTGRGQRPLNCDDHADNPRRHKPGAQLVPCPDTPSHQYEQRQRRKEKRSRTDARATSKQALARLLAISMRIEPNAKKALEMAGLDEAATEAGIDPAAVLRLAKSKAYAPLREGLQSEIAKGLSVALQLMVERLIVEYPEIPIANLAFAIGQVRGAIEALGGFEVAHTELHYTRVIEVVSTEDAGQLPH